MITRPSLTHLRELTWPEVFEIWRAAEMHSASWRALYTQRGFASWDAWRLSFAQPLKLLQLHWSLFDVREPGNFILDCIGGPYRGWFERYYTGKQTPTFRELADVPALRQHPGIHQLMENFPATTTLIAVKVNNHITIIEGMHRSMALAISEVQKKPLHTHLRLALASHPDTSLPLL